MPGVSIPESLIRTVAPVAVTLLIVFTGTAFADPASDQAAVESTVKSAVEKVLVVLKNKSLEDQQRRDQVIEIIDPLVDFELMARLSLGKKRWVGLTPEERTSFTGLFVKTLHALYFEKLEMFTDETVEYEAAIAKKTKYYMQTYIVSKGERIKVAYKLFKKKDQWLVYDFEIEGVSIVKSYSSQYREFLQDGTFEQLLAKMREKIAASKETAKPPESSQ